MSVRVGAPVQPAIGAGTGSLVAVFFFAAVLAIALLVAALGASAEDVPAAPTVYSAVELARIAVPSP